MAPPFQGVDGHTVQISPMEAVGMGGNEMHGREGMGGNGVDAMGGGEER